MAPSRNRNSEAASTADVSMVDAPDNNEDYTDYQDTPDYTVRVFIWPRAAVASLITAQDSDSNLNTAATSDAGDGAPTDGRKRRSEALQLRKSVLGKKHDRLGESKVCRPAPLHRASF